MLHANPYLKVYFADKSCRGAMQQTQLTNTSISQHTLKLLCCQQCIIGDDILLMLKIAPYICLWIRPFASHRSVLVVSFQYQTLAGLSESAMLGMPKAEKAKKSFEDKTNLLHGTALPNISLRTAFPPWHLSLQRSSGHMPQS